MARIAVVAVPDAGHALPALGVAAALRARGHPVRFVSGLEHAASAAAHDLEVHPWPRTAPAPHDDDLGRRIWGTAAAAAVPLARSLAAWETDLVVADTLTLSGAFAAQLLGRSWVELIPHHLDDPADDLPPIGLGRRRARSPWRRYDDRRIVGLQRRSREEGARQAQQAARSVGLHGLETPCLRLLGTLPSLERPRALWPADAHVVGPLAIDPALPELPAPEGDAPLVVVTDSTAANVERHLGEVALRALAGCDLRVVVTSASLPPRRSAQMVVGRGPHAPLLARAAVAVGFGGAGFVGKALSAGVPLVVVPLQGDQREAAARLREAGVARILPLRALTPTRLRWAIVRVTVDSDARERAAALSLEAAALGPGLAARLVEAAARGTPPAASGPRHHLPASPVLARK